MPVEGFLSFNNTKLPAVCPSPGLDGMLVFTGLYPSIEATATSFKNCVVPGNMHTSPTEQRFSKTPHPSGNSD